MVARGERDDFPRTAQRVHTWDDIESRLVPPEHNSDSDREDLLKRLADLLKESGATSPGAWPNQIGTPSNPYTWRTPGPTNMQPWWTIQNFPLDSSKWTWSVNC